MILPGTRKVQLDTILVPKGSIAARKKAPQHESRKASIKRHGLINLIVIQDRTRKLLAGGDRLAALLALKVKAHEVRVFRGTEEEFEALQLAENIERRHNDDVDALTRRYVELTMDEIEKVAAETKEAERVAAHASRLRELDPDLREPIEAAYPGPGPEPKTVGRPKTTAGRARELVAAATGKTPEAVRQAEKRARQKEDRAIEEARTPPVDPAEPLPPPVETYGLPLLSDDDAYQVVVAQEALKRLDGAVGKALAALATQVGRDTLAARICSAATSALSQAAVEVCAAYPRAVCPSCKRVTARMEKCEVCAETGFVGVTAWLNAPDELRLGGEQAKVSDGKGGYVPYSREVARAEKAAAKKLRIELPDGSTLEGGE